MPTHTIVLLILIPLFAVAARASIILESTAEIFSHSYSHGLPGGDEESDTLAAGTGHTAVVRLLSGLDGITPWSSSVAILQASHLTTETTAADDWLRVDAESSVFVQTTATGGAAAQTIAENSLDFIFEIGGGDPMPYFMSGTFLPGANPADNVLQIRREDSEGNWTILEVDAAAVVDDEGRFEAQGDFIPGRYRLRAALAAAAVSPGDGSAIPCRAKFSIGIGTAPTLPPAFGDPPNQVPYWCPGLLTPDLPAPDLQTDRLEVLAFHSFDGGFVDVDLAIGFSNNSRTPWTSARALIDENIPGGPEIEFRKAGFHTFARPGESSFARSDFTTVRVAVADLPALLAQLAAFERIHWRGDQNPTFSRPIFPFGPQATPGLKDYFAEPPPPFFTHLWPANGDYEFKVGTDFAQGTLLYYPDASKPAPQNRHGRLIHDSLSGHLPAEVVSSSDDPDNGSVSLKRVFLPDFLIDGVLSFSLGAEPEVSSSESLYPRRPPDRSEIRIAQSDLIENRARPIHFNRVKLDDFIEVHGSFALKPIPLSVELEMEEGVVTRFVLETGMTADVNLLVTLLSPVNNQGAPLAEKQKRILALPLFVFPTPHGIDITPTLTLDVGVAADATQELTIPLTSGIDTRVRFGWANGETFYEETATPVTPRLSDPAVFEQVGAHVEAWLAAQLALVLSHPVVPVGGAPTIGARANARFQIHPFADPTWTLEGDLDVRAGFEVSLLGLLNIADAQRVLSNTPLFSISSPPTAMSPMSGFDPPLNPGIRPIAGQNTRWVRALRARELSTPADAAFLLPALGSDDIYLGATSGGGREIARITPDGGLRWLLTDGSLSNTFRPRHGVSEPHGGLTVLGGNGELSLVQFDAQGQQLWKNSQTIATGGLLLYTPKRLLRRDEEGGGHAYWVLGQASVTATRQHLVLSKFDGAGQLLWHRLLTQNAPATADVAVFDARFAADGSIVAAGAFTGTWQAGEPIEFITRNGLLISLDPETGDTRWTTRMIGTRITEYYALAEDPEGNLYAAGRHFPVVTDDHPSNLISKFSPSGQHLFSRLIGHDPEQKGLADPSTALPSNGETFWDQVNTLLWVDDALWAGGQIGLSSNPEGSQGFVMRLTPELGVTRFASYNGPSAPSGFGGNDRVLALADGGAGLLVLADSFSFLPWPAGREGNTPFSPCRLLFKMPWESSLRFHDLSTGRKADPGEKRGMFYLFPRVYEAGAARPSGFPAMLDHSPILPLNNPLPNTPAAPNINLTLQEPHEYRALEHIPPSRIQSIEDYFAWHQLAEDPDGDTDGDGRPERVELFLGSDPWRKDPGPLPQSWTRENGESPAWVLGIPRSPLARDLGLLPTLFSSTTLDNDWEPETRHLLQTESLPGGAEILRFILPAEDVPEPNLFFRLEFP